MHVLLRILFVLSVIWGALIFWIAPHPPMIDLPQHAAQVTLMHDMLLGQSPWSELFRINLLTPYIIGYGLALPLSFVMPIAAAVKLLLSLAYIAFVYMCVKLRRHFGADARLDWLFLLSFFGFAYTWGFFTYLVAAPIGLYFILLADRYAKHQSVGRACGIAAAGLILLASHGLVFLFAVGTGMALLVMRGLGVKALIRPLLPYALLVLACGIYFLISREASQGMHMQDMGRFSWALDFSRLYKPLIYSLAPNGKDHAVLLLMAAVALMLCIPWMLGLRIDWHNRASWTPFAVLSIILLFVPSFAFGTAFLYQRFALFLLPAYAWLFTRKATSAVPGKPSANKRWRSPAGAAFAAIPLLLAICWSVLGLNTLRSWRFAQETAGINAMIAAVAPGQRGVSLVIDQASRADGNTKIYAHYPVWYQAERHGLVDFNFAWFPPQIVRYQTDHLPAIGPQFDWHPERFDWVKNRGNDYRYFFVRLPGGGLQSGLQAELFDGAKCMPQPIMSRGNWTVFEHKACPQARQFARSNFVSAPRSNR